MHTETPSKLPASTEESSTRGLSQDFRSAASRQCDGVVVWPNQEGNEKARRSRDWRPKVKIGYWEDRRTTATNRQADEVVASVKAKQKAHAARNTVRALAHEKEHQRRANHAFLRHGVRGRFVSTATIEIRRDAHDAEVGFSGEVSQILHASFRVIHRGSNVL